MVRPSARVDHCSPIGTARPRPRSPNRCSSVRVVIPSSG